MMRNALRALFMLMILSLGVTATAYGQSDEVNNWDTPFYQDLEGEASNQDGSGDFYFCAAKGSWGGKCRDCVWDDAGKKMCGSVAKHGKCHCRDNCATLKGICNYEP